METTEHYLVTRYRTMLAARGHTLTGESKILDFGCGRGAFVYTLRDAGLDAVGFDILDFLALREPGDARFFFLAENPVPYDKNAPIDPMSPPPFDMDWKTYRLPFEDGTFDFVISHETMEHVMDYEPALRELARVTKRNGVQIHCFPARWRFIEPHIFVPLGSIIRSYWYYFLWALAGVRNQYQKTLSASQTATVNLRYARHCLNYPPPRELKRLAKKFFGSDEFVPELWEPVGGKRRGSWRWWLYTRFFEVIWMLQNPLHPAATNVTPRR